MRAMNRWVGALTALVLVAAPTVVVAGGLIDWAGNTGDAAKAVGKAIVLVFFVGGIAAAGMGLFRLMNENQRRQNGVGGSILLLVVGVVLSSLLFFMGGVSETFFGADETARAFGDIGL